MKAYSLTLSLAHCIVCSMAAGKDFKVQKGISSSGGSRCNCGELWVNANLLKFLANNSMKTRLCKLKPPLL